MYLRLNCTVKMLLALILLSSVLLCAAKPTPEIDPRIVGGYSASEGQFPYQVALRLDQGTSNENFCGGSIISPNYILTAAHCVSKFSQVTAVLGSIAINDTTPHQVVINSTEFIIPEQYDSSTHIWDLALIVLPQTIEFNDYIQPITLAEGNDTFAGDVAVVAGWGFQGDYQTEVESLLRYTENVVLSNRQCIKSDQIYQVYVKDTHICQSTLAGRGACHGDSGGALVVEGVEIGIVSFGGNSCVYGKPVVFTRVASYRDWIRENSGV